MDWEPFLAVSTRKNYEQEHTLQSDIKITQTKTRPGTTAQNKEYSSCGRAGGAACFRPL